MPTLCMMRVRGLFCGVLFFVSIVKKGSWKNGLSHTVTKEIKIQVHRLFYLCFSLLFAVGAIPGQRSDLS